MLRLALVLSNVSQALLAPVTQTRRNKLRIRDFFDDLICKRAATSGAPPPQIQAFLAGASPQAQREYAALQDAFPVGASEDVRLEWRAFEQVFAGRQASGSSETAWAQQEAFEFAATSTRLEPHAPDQLASCRATKRPRRRRTPAARRRRGQGASSAGPRLARARRFRRSWATSSGPATTRYPTRRKRGGTSSWIR